MAERPLLAIAHRAGNHLGLLKKVEAIGADFVEADVRLHNGRIEVRHLKTLRHVPLLYDRWKVFGRWRLGFSVAPGWTNRLVLEALLTTVSPATGILIDLKGDDEALAPSVLDALRKSPRTGEAMICSQNWRHIEALRGESSVTPVHSIGRAAQLNSLRALPGFTTGGISIDSALLTADVVGELHERAPLVITWAINSRTELDRVRGYGVDGVISDSLNVLRAVVTARDRPCDND